MKLARDGTTNRTLLREVADWENQLAWLRFLETYNPLLARCCRGYGLDRDSIDEVCQRIWIELADRMKTFEYDPNRSFRGWLRRLCESRVLNFLKGRRRDLLQSLDQREDQWTLFTRGAAIDNDATDETDDLPHRLLIREGERVQAAVRAKVKPSTWDAFWLVAICDWSVERTAHSLGMTKVAVYAARDRVARMLGEEGKCFSSGLGAGM